MHTEEDKRDPSSNPAQDRHYGHQHTHKLPIAALPTSAINAPEGQTTRVRFPVERK